MFIFALLLPQTTIWYFLLIIILKNIQIYTYRKFVRAVRCIPYTLHLDLPDLLTFCTPLCACVFPSSVYVYICIHLHMYTQLMPIILDCIFVNLPTC